MGVGKRAWKHENAKMHRGKMCWRGVCSEMSYDHMITRDPTTSSDDSMASLRLPDTSASPCSSWSCSKAISPVSAHAKNSMQVGQFYEPLCFLLQPPKEGKIVMNKHVREEWKFQSQPETMPDLSGIGQIVSVVAKAYQTGLGDAVQLRYPITLGAPVLISVQHRWQIWQNDDSSWGMQKKTESKLASYGCH